MAISKKLTALISAVAFTTGAAFAAETPGASELTDDYAAPTIAAAGGTVEAVGKTASEIFVSMFDTSKWYDGHGDMDQSRMAQPEHVNMAHPNFWMSFVDPETHTKRHMQFTNPGMYAQFMKPAVYMEFVKPANWLAWFDVKNYELLVEGETYTYWMQPGAYTHAIQPEGYMQMFDLDNYSEFLQPATYVQFFNPEAYQLTSLTEGLDDAVEAVNPVTMLNNVVEMASK